MTKYVLVVLLVLATAIAGFGQTQNKARAEAYYHFSKARLLDDQGQASQAIDEFKRALELDLPSRCKCYVSSEQYLDFFIHY